MEVLDIVHSAATKSGVVPSFNPDDLPEDVLETGRNVLNNDILPALNCDRTLDITETCRVYTPVNGRIVLTPFKPTGYFEIIGYTNLTSAEMRTQDSSGTTFGKEISKMHHDWVHVTAHSILRNDENWPHDEAGNFANVAIWCRDMKLVYGTDTLLLPNIHQNANIDFPPMRVDGVIDANSKCDLQFVYRDEFERTDRIDVYTTEEYEDCLVVLFHNATSPKKLILPVPLQIVNVTDEHAGTIIAPAKFRRYLIDTTAVSLAVIYGMSTLPTMQQEAGVSYNLLKKNKPQQQHMADVSEVIRKHLSNPWRRA